MVYARRRLRRGSSGRYCASTRRQARYTGMRQQRVEHDHEQDLAHEQERDGRVDAEQELEHGEADRGDRRRGGADRHGHEAVGRVAQLAQPPRAVADAEQHERGQPHRLREHGVGEQADPEAEARAGDRAAEQADRADQQRRQVGGDAEDRHLRDGGELQDAADQSDGDEAGDGGGRPAHGVPGGGAQVRGRLGEDLDEVDAAQVGERARRGSCGRARPRRRSA